jgi:hypothetical protein
MPEPAATFGLLKQFLELVAKVLPFMRRWHGLSVEVKQCEHGLMWGMRQDGRPDRNLYELHTYLVARFENGDTIKHVVKGVSLVLKRRWMPLLWATARSSAELVTNSSKRSAHVRLSDGLEVPPRALSDFYCFALYTPLPRGRSALRHYTARIRFALVGGKVAIEKVPVSCPKAQRVFAFEDAISGVSTQLQINPFAEEEASELE